MPSSNRSFWVLCSGLILALFGMLLLPHSQPAVKAQTTPPPPGQTFISRSVSVTGSGAVQVKPDLAYITLGVQTNATTASQALTQNSTQMQEVISTLTQASIPAADIRTTAIQIYPQYTASPPPTPLAPDQAQPQPTQTNQITGYVAVNTVEVTVRNLNNLGTLLDQVVQSGSNQVENIRFDLANPTTAMDQARDAAMKDANHKAAQLASLSGGASLGPILTIVENSSRPIPFQMAEGQARDTAAAVPVSAGLQTITVDVQVSWSLQP